MEKLGNDDTLNIRKYAKKAITKVWTSKSIEKLGISKNSERKRISYWQTSEKSNKTRTRWSQNAQSKKISRQTVQKMEESVEDIDK